MNRQPEFKVAVSLFKKYCKEHNITLSHSHVLELVAIDRGYASYNVYRAQEKAQAISTQPAIPIQKVEPESSPEPSGFINVQDVHTPIVKPDEGTQAMYAGMDNPRKDNKMAQALPALSPLQVNTKKELFSAILESMHCGRINGVAGEMRVNRENLKKLIAGKAQFEDEIIHFAYPHPYPETLDKYRPGEISIIAHVMEMIVYLDYGQWFIPGIGSVNFNNRHQELIGTPLQTRLKKTHSAVLKSNDSDAKTTFNVFANGELVLPDVQNFFEASHKAENIAEDDIFGGFSEVRDAQNDELVYYHAYGFQVPVYTKEKDARVILKTSKKEASFPELSENATQGLIQALNQNKNPHPPTDAMKKLMSLPNLPMRKK